MNEPVKKKRRVYTAFTDQQRAAIGKYAAECGNAAALRKYHREVPDHGESTVRLFKKRYLEQLRASPNTEVTSIASRKRGRPLALGDVDQDVQKFITALCWRNMVGTSGRVHNTSRRECGAQRRDASRMACRLCKNSQLSRPLLLVSTFTKLSMFVASIRTKLWIFVDKPSIFRTIDDYV